MKIRHICAFLGGLSALLALPVSGSFAADTNVNASLMNTEFQAEQDSDFTTTIYVPENSNISNFQAVLNYDSDCVSLVEAKPCESSAGTVTVNSKDGKLYIAFSSAENQTDKVNIVDLKFHVADDLSGGKYNFISIDKSATNSAASNTIGDQFTTYDLSPTFSTMNIYQYGDSNLDGRIISMDVTYLKQYLVKLRDISDLSKKYSNACLDFETDGTTPTLNSRDALVIQQKVVDMDVNLGDRVNVKFYKMTKFDNDPSKREYELYATKSIKAGSSLKNIPNVPDLVGFGESKWSSSKDSMIDVDFSKVNSDMEVYSWYADEDPNIQKLNDTVNALELGFAQSGKYITDDFQLPYKSNYGSFNMLSTADYSGLDIIWNIDSGALAQSINMSHDYIVDIPTGDNQIPYTTWVTFTANIMFNGKKYGSHEFKREVKGKVDVPSPTAFQNVLKSIPIDFPEHYRLPGYMTLESSRLSYGVNLVQNVDIKWSVVKNSDGSTADQRALDSESNEIIYLKDKNNITLQADFIFNGETVYTDRISRTIPAESIEGQIEYAKNYIQSYVPSVISGETYFPTSVPLYDLTVSWIPDIESGKVKIGKNETINGITYKILDVGEKAGYMEWAKAYANIERNGDKSFAQTGLEFNVQLAGNSSEISTDKIPDVNLYKALVNIFDKTYGNNDGILTEEEIYNTETMEKLKYKVDLSNKGITNISGIKYLKYYRKIDLSGNDLGGTNASLGDLANLNRLEQLSMSNCNISSIPDSVFASKHLIEGIDLSYNKLKDVNFLALKDSRTHFDCAYTELKELFLQGNYISDISNLAFTNDKGENVSRIPNVNVLTLSRDINYFEYKTSKKTGKKILKKLSSKLDEDKYEYDIKTPMNIAPIGLLKNVSTLWLANNSITDIEPLKNCKLLATLDLSGNSIVATAANDGLEPLSKLQSIVCLKLDGNADIQTVRSLSKLIYLDVLSLSNNKIGNVSGILDRLTQLTYLDLDNNNLSSFDAGCFQKIKRLYLENNGVPDDNGEIKEEFKLNQVQNLSTDTNLIELRLNGNNIDKNTIDGISSLTHLKYLSLSGNSVTDLDFLKNLSTLTHLELARCNIRQNRTVTNVNSTTGEQKTEEISNISYLAGLTNLCILDISDNKDINSIKELSTLTKLGVFYANNIKLDDAMAIRSMTKLQYLSMQNSGLKDLSFLNTLNLLEFLNLSGHNADAFDFRNIKNYEYIVALFLDSASGTEAININSFTNKQNLRYMSIANMHVGSIDLIPDMDNITYLGLRNTGIKDFNGTNSGTDGFIKSITRFKTLKYIDVADNPELFTKNNLEMLYDFVGQKDNPKSIILYRDNAPEGYVPGIMDASIEAKALKNDVNFGTSSDNMLTAMSAGYQLQEALNGYDVEWQLEDNELYYVKDGKLYFRNTKESDASAKLALTMAIKGLYYRQEDTNTKEKTPVSFTASIKTTSELRPTGEKKFVKTEYTTSTDNTLDGWLLDNDLTEYGGINWGEWSGWSTNAVSENELRNVQTKTENGYSEWGGWSDWITDYVASSDLRQVETIQEPYGYTTNHYFSACAASYKSITDALKSIGADSSFASRNNIAANNGISNYKGTYDQNVQMLNLLKNGQLIEWVENCTGYTTKYHFRDRSTTSTTYYSYRDGVRVPSVYHFHRDIYEDVNEDAITGMTLVVE